MSGDLDPSVSVGKRRVGIGGPGGRTNFWGRPPWRFLKASRLSWSGPGGLQEASSSLKTAPEGVWAGAPDAYRRLPTPTDGSRSPEIIVRPPGPDAYQRLPTPTDGSRSPEMVRPPELNTYYY